MKRSALILLLILAVLAVRSEDGYRLWLRYDLVSDPALLHRYRRTLTSLQFDISGSPTLRVARDELTTGLTGLLGNPVPLRPDAVGDGALLVGTPASLLPAGSEPPDHTLDYYRKIQLYYAPGAQTTGVNFK